MVNQHSFTSPLYHIPENVNSEQIWITMGLKQKGTGELNTVKGTLYFLLLNQTIAHKTIQRMIIKVIQI